jgi:hypothetical protein
MQFDINQREAVSKLKPGSILVGGTGSGKSRTALVYFFSKICGGKIVDRFEPVKDHIPLYIITTAAKRDKKEWDEELKEFPILQYTIDSWNNIKKYVDIKNAFFIFDEQRVVGSGTWSKSFIKISKENKWILLSATPGDTWIDYIPVFIANGFYKNRTEFLKRHVVFSRYTKYPKVERYIEEDLLKKIKDKILINMDIKRRTIPHRINVITDYNKESYKIITKDRWDFINNKPIEYASQYVQLQRRVVNSDNSKIARLKEIIELHNKLIIFYNFDYERDIILELIKDINISYGELNGHHHTKIPNTEKWIYLVQYNAGSEGWNCIETNTIIFFSLSYSYRMMHQAAGRIDRRNTPYLDLYYYYFYTKSSIDNGILKCLEIKKNFNEKKYYEKMTS